MKLFLNWKFIGTALFMKIHLKNIFLKGNSQRRTVYEPIGYDLIFI